jgi:anthranilate synthase component 1
VHRPDQDTFCRQAKPGRVIPVCREVVADLLTPLTAFLRLDKNPAQAAYLLESVEGGEKWGRYSFIGVAPRRRIRHRGKTLAIDVGEGWSEAVVANPLHDICQLVRASEPLLNEGMPRFWGGLVGYLGYDTVRCIENLPDQAERDSQLWDSYLIEAGIIVILDALRQRALIVCPTHIDEGTDTAQAWRLATAQIDAAAERLQTPEPATSALHVYDSDVDPADNAQLKANMDKDAFTSAVARAKDYIQAGDIIQVVLSRRFELEAESVCPFDLYRALRLTNPSPYLFFLRYPEYALVGASPEVLVRREGSNVEVRPIAGTRRRGKTEEDDLAIEAELRADPKEVAEHVMLLDLGRNDVGRISEVGSVRVPDNMVVERYAYVMHLVSSVHGTLRSDVDVEGVIRATFPAGTLSGAPKVRAMEIIEELEPHGRGVYGGAAGYLGYDGNLDLAIAIRSVLAMNDTLHVQVGAGIVYDSTPEREYEETREKARGVLRAIRLVQEEQP